MMSLHINNPLTMENPPRFKFTPNFFIIISLSLGLFSFIFCVAAEIKRNKVQMLTTIFTASISSPEIKTFQKGTLFCRRMISGGRGSYVLCHQARPLGWELQLWLLSFSPRSSRILYYWNIVVGEENENPNTRYQFLQRFWFSYLGRLSIFSTYVVVKLLVDIEHDNIEIMVCGIEVEIEMVIFCRVSFGFAGILLITATSMNRRQAYRVGWLNGECYVVKGGTYAGSAMLVLFAVCSMNGSAFSTFKSSQSNQSTEVHKPMGWRRKKHIFLVMWKRKGEIMKSTREQNWKVKM